MVNYYKIKLCGSYEHNKTCSYGENCNYAHGKEELRCKYFQEGKCKFEDKCFLIHDKKDDIINENIVIDDYDNSKKDILTDLKINEYIENIKESKQSIQFDINTEKIKKQNLIDWVDEHSDIGSDEYKKDPFEINTEKKITELEKYILSLKEYINKIEYKKDNLISIPDIFWKKLINDININEKILNI